MPWLVEAIHWGFVIVTSHREQFGFKWDKRTSLINSGDQDYTFFSKMYIKPCF